MHAFWWLSLLLLLYIVRNDENKDDKNYISFGSCVEWNEFKYQVIDIAVIATLCFLWPMADRKWVTINLNFLIIETGNGNGTLDCQLIRETGSTFIWLYVICKYSLFPSDAVLSHLFGSSFMQLLSCHQFGIRPLTEPMFGYSQVGFKTKIKGDLSKK